MNISNIFVVATSLVALTSANPNSTVGDFGVSSAGAANLKLTDYVDTRSDGKYTGIGSMTVALTSKTPWNVSTSAVAAFVVCIQHDLKDHCYVGEVTDPAGEKIVTFSGWMETRISRGATLDNSASLLTQMKAIIGKENPDCANVNEVGSGKSIDVGRC